MELKGLPLMLLLWSSVESFWQRGEPPSRSRSHTLELLMPGVHPAQADDYYCTAYNLSYEEAYIVALEPKLDQANHMLLIGCGSIFKAHQQLQAWNCDSNNVCEDPTVLYGWAKNASMTQLPQGVGFQVGQKTPVRYLLLQVHYSKALPESETDCSGLRLRIDLRPQRYLAGIQVLYAKGQTIPPNRRSFPVDVNCKARLDSSLFVFAYRVHTHSLGTAVRAYLYRPTSRRWTLLASGDPHRPQAFYPINQTVMVQPGDILASRCTYNTTSKKEPTEIGPGASEEMCNLYLMYYAVLGPGGRSGGQCENLERPDLVHELPREEVEEMETPPGAFAYRASSGWPSSAVHLGQVVAVSLDGDGNVVVFHRGSRIWSKGSFDFNNVYQRVEEGPIPESTVLTLDPGNGHLIHRWGSHQFFMPHGLTVDGQGFIWVTDVALHQVHKYPKGGGRDPLLTLGERFQPGGDTHHFCKPTSVAVTAAGDFYVADGYCNARVVHFDKQGKFLRQIGEAGEHFGLDHPPAGSFAIPHKVVLAEPQRLLCVADRENGRIQCFALDSGDFRFQISLPEFFGQLYSVSYGSQSQGGLLMAVTGPRAISNPSKGFVFNLTSQQLLGTLAPPQEGSFSMPHDITCSEDAQEVYVAEINPNRLWRFVREVHRSSKKVLPPAPPAPVQTVAPSLKEPEDNFGVSMVIMALLAIPILSFLVITIIVRLRRQGIKEEDMALSQKGLVPGGLDGQKEQKLTRMKILEKLKKTGLKSQGKFDLGQLLNPHRGFDRVALEESGSEDANGPTSDSDVEEFNAATHKA